MERTLEQKAEKWFTRQEPSSQIDILKFIATEGFLSKTELAERTGSKISNLENTMKNIEYTQKSEDKLIQRFGSRKVIDGKKEQVVYSLAEKGIRVLLENHYQKNGKPYLTKKDFIKFIALYFDKNSLYQKVDDFKGWKNPNLSKKEIFDLYRKANPSLEVEFEQGKYVIDVLEWKENTIKKFEKKLDEIENELADEMYKELTKGLKKGKLYKIKKYIKEDIEKDANLLIKIIKGDWI